MKSRKYSIVFIIVIISLIIAAVLFVSKNKSIKSDNFSDNEQSSEVVKKCSDYITRADCALDAKCAWPGPSCAIPGKNCGFAYKPDLDRCLPK